MVLRHRDRRHAPSLIVYATSLLSVHEQWAWFVIVSCGLAGCWALAAHFWAPARRRALWVFTAIAQLSVFVQATLGTIIVARSDADPPQFHIFYGFLCVIAVSIITGYRHQLAEYRYLLYGGGGLFVMGLAIRALEIGPGR